VKFTVTGKHAVRYSAIVAIVCMQDVNYLLDMRSVFNGVLGIDFCFRQSAASSHPAGGGGLVL